MLLALLIAGVGTTAAFADGPATGGWTSARPDGHAPIGIMGDHRHAAGEWMLAYRFGFMDMEGNRDGTDGLSTEEVLADFPVSPESMTMEMHMFGLMYAPVDRLTLVFMAPLVDVEMEHVTRMGVEFTTRTRGLGDVQLSGLFGLLDRGRHSLHLNFGISAPTGTLDSTDDTPAGPDQPLPYPMQIGSGTWDVTPGLTLFGQSDDFSWGFQNLDTVRIGESSRDYTLGNRYLLTAWAAWRLGRWISVSGRAAGTIQENIDGADPRLNPMMVPTARTDLRGGERIELFGGINLYLREGFLAGHRFAVEAGAPVYQSLDGPQLETDFRIITGWQYAFDLPPTSLH